MMHTTDSALDLHNDLGPILFCAAIIGMVALALWLYERKHDGRPDARGTAERHRSRTHPEDDARGDRASAGDPTTGHARGTRRDTADDHRMVGGHRRRADRAQHDRQPRGSRLALTDDELVALARYFYRAGLARREPAIELIPLLDKIERAASDVLHADRLGRR